MEINCKFIPYGLYQCNITESSITEKDHVIKEFKGVHQKGKSHKDVKCVFFRSTEVNHFPRNLQKHFPNLTHLLIIECGIKEITRNDLKGLERLVCLQISECQLTTLPDDLLTAMPNLREVNFYGNKIELESSEVFKPLLGRENVRVNLLGNKNIYAFYIPGSPGSLHSLEELMTLIDEKCLKPASSIIRPDPIKPALPKYSDSVDVNPKLKKIKEMWLSGKFSDLTIIAGDKKFKVHKNVLGMESEVFAQIFEDQIEATEIRIPGFSANSVEALLKFIYTNEASEDENARENFDIADKFKVAEMKSIYEKVIGDRIDESNALEVFLFAHRFSSQLLKKKAFQKMAEKNSELPEELIEYPEKLKKLIEYRRGYEEMLAESKKLKIIKK